MHPMRPAILLLAALALAGCEERPEFRGAGCELTSECNELLICVFGRCRQECRANVDCALGLDCLNDEASGRGCQLPEELSCEADEDCTGGLICRRADGEAMGECGQVCAEDRDCVEGSVCETAGGTSTCEPVSSELCVYDSDCAPGLVCSAYQECIVECREDRDCDPPRVCGEMTIEGAVTPLCVLPDGGA